MVIHEQSAREVQACVDALETTSPVSATEIGRVLLWFVLINFFPDRAVQYSGHNYEVTHPF